MREPKGTNETSGARRISDLLETRDRLQQAWRRTPACMATEPP